MIGRTTNIREPERHLTCRARIPDDSLHTNQSHYKSNAIIRSVYARNVCGNDALYAQSSK